MSCAELSKLCFVAVFVNVQAHSSHAHFYGKCIAGVTQLSSTFTVRWDIWQTSRKRGESKCNTVVLAAPQVSLVLSHATGQMWPTAARVEKNNKPMCARPSSWDVAPLLLQKRRKRERRRVVMKMLPESFQGWLTFWLDRQQQVSVGRTCCPLRDHFRVVGRCKQAVGGNKNYCRVRMTWMSQSDSMGSLSFGRCPTGKVFFVLTHVIGFVLLTLSATI